MFCFSRVSLFRIVFSSFFFFNFTILYWFLPYINVNPPQVYTCSQSWTPSHLPPHTIPLGHPSAPAPSILYPESNLDWRFVSYMILYMFQCHSPKSSPTQQSPRIVSSKLPVGPGRQRADVYWIPRECQALQLLPRWVHSGSELSLTPTS